MSDIEFNSHEQVASAELVASTDPKYNQAALMDVTSQEFFSSCKSTQGMIMYSAMLISLYRSRSTPEQGSACVSQGLCQVTIDKAAQEKADNDYSCALTKTFNGSLASHKRDELETMAGALLLQTMVEQTARIKEHFAANPVSPRFTGLLEKKRTEDM